MNHIDLILRVFKCCGLWIQQTMVDYTSAWIGKVETTLEHMGMSSLFDVITNTRKSWFKNNTKVRLNNIYAHIWSESVVNKSVYLNYKAMTVVKKKTYILKLQKKNVYILCR